MMGRLRTGIEQNMFVRSSGARDSRDTILWIHGLGESGLCFEELVTAAELAHWRHLVPDLPGYGKSPWPRVPMSMLAYADVLGEWLQEKGQEPVVVAGHSMGGVIGTFLSERFPGVARALLNIEGNVSEEDCTTSGQVAEHTRDSFMDRGFAALLRTVYQAGSEDDSFRMYYPSLRICDPRCLYLNGVELVEFSREEMLAMRMRGLKIPTVYFSGDPGGAGARSRSLLDRAGIRWVPVPDTGHWPFLDQPEAFTALLLEELSALQ